jgi:hypothetical protein
MSICFRELRPHIRWRMINRAGRSGAFSGLKIARPDLLQRKRVDARADDDDVLLAVGRHVDNTIVGYMLLQRGPAAEKLLAG